MCTFKLKLIHEIILSVLHVAVLKGMSQILWFIAFKAQPGNLPASALLFIQDTSVASAHCFTLYFRANLFYYCFTILRVSAILFEMPCEQTSWRNAKSKNDKNICR